MNQNQPDQPTDVTGEAFPTPERADGSEGPRDASERPGDFVGPYKLMSVLGEGGFGTVWLAERREPMVQRVALKIIKPGMDSKSVIARFEQERQALAVMDHPNVARVFDGGVTERGRPYFVMELVKGAPITAFADRLRMTLRQRLELFIPVCEAVQHAHTKGIIHRDLKPSNILVEEIGGSPVVKVIDFGIAKAIAQPEWAQTAFTQEGAVIGTPEYMSPEQVSGLADVDTRSDVYSLGVVLYELLAGELPFDSRHLRRAALVEIQRVIREVAPPKPSTRLMQIARDQTTQIVARRATTRERLTAELRRELDWIPLMAIRKERDRRYASAGALAGDVRRYLDGLPLIAAPDSRAYLAKKFVRRNKVQVIAGAAVFLALSVGLGVSLWQRAEAEEQRVRADERADAATKAEAAATAARDAEKERAEQLKKVSDFQSEMLAQIDTTKAGLDLMADVRERFVAALDDDGVPETERGAQVKTLGELLVRVNATDTAAAMIDRTILRPAVAAIDEQFKDDPATDASLRQSLANLYESIGLYDHALPLQESALSTRRSVLGNEHPETLRSIKAMGVLLQSQGKLAEAEPYCFEALEQRRRVLGQTHPDTLSSVANVGSLLHAQGKLDQAEPYLVEDLDMSRALYGEEHPHTISAMNNLAGLRQAQGKLGEAEGLFKQVVDLCRRALGADHQFTLSSVHNMGTILQDVGRLAEAESYFREALEGCRRVLGDEHPETLVSVSKMGGILHSQGKLLEAEPYYREAIEKSRRVLGSDHPHTLTFINNLGLLLRDQRKYAEAEPLYREVLAQALRVLGEEHPDVLIFTSNLGTLLMAQDKLAESEQLLRAAMEKSIRVLGDGHPDTLISICDMAVLLRRQAKHQEIIDLLVPAEASARSVFTGGNARRLADFLAELGRARVGLGYGSERFTLAESNLLEAHAIYAAAKDRGPTHKDTLACVQGLIDLYTAWHAAEPEKGYDAKAAEWRAVLEAGEGG